MKSREEIAFAELDLQQFETEFAKFWDEFSRDLRAIRPGEERSGQTNGTSWHLKARRFTEALF